MPIAHLKTSRGVAGAQRRKHGISCNCTRLPGKSPVVTNQAALGWLWTWVGEPADHRRIQPFPQAHHVPAGAWGPALTVSHGMAQALLDWERHSHGCSPSRPQVGTTCLCVSIRPPRARPLLSKAFLPGAVRPGCEQPKRDRITRVRACALSQHSK